MISLNITIIDVNDNAPTFERPEYHLRIPETAEPGTSFELPVARDADPTPQYGVMLVFLFVTPVMFLFFHFKITHNLFFYVWLHYGRLTLAIG